MTSSNVAKRYAAIKDIDAQIAALQADRSKHIAVLARSEVGRHTLSSGGSFTVSENNVYSEEAIRAALTPGQVKRCTKAVLDKPVVKRLYPEVYAAAKENRGYKVSVS